MPLRPYLFERLEDRFGEVLIAHEGEPMMGQVCTDLTHLDHRGRPIKVLQVYDAGEEYRVDCPYCYDTRKRLYINHMWAYLLDTRGVSYMWLVNCFNENCFTVPGRKKELFKMVYDDVGYAQRDFAPAVLPAKVLAKIEPLPIPLPGPLQPLHALPASHPANVYLRGRGFDPELLSKKFRVAYCEKAVAEMLPAGNRIIVPMHMDGDLVGWQARFIGEPTEKWCPKYYSMPRMLKSAILYNFDSARHYSAVVVVEGITDVWSVGPQAVALLGKVASPYQIGLLSRTWGNGTAIVLLDADAEKESKELTQKLGAVLKNVVRVQLPEGLDPGNCDRMTLKQLIWSAAVQQGVDLSTALPPMKG
jgi:hypothetical protein